MTDTIYQGDTIELEYAIENRTLSINWHCLVHVKKSTDTPALIELELDLNPQETEFTGLLDTSSLLPGSYGVYAELSNPATSERCEIHQRITIRNQGVVATGA